MTEPSVPTDAAPRDPATSDAPADGHGGGTDRLDEVVVQAHRMELLGRLVPGVAHELSNSLAAMTAFSRLLARDPRLADELRDDAGRLVEEADRTARIVLALLEFARRRPAERHPTSVRALVGSIVDLQGDLMRSSRVTLDVDVPDDLATVPIDRAEMQQVLLTLTSDAIESVSGTGGPGRIVIRAREVAADEAAPAAGPFVRIEVATGRPGAGAESLAPGAEPPSTSNADEPVAWGLAVAAAIVAAHGGRFSREGDADRGDAGFFVDLPIAPAPVARPALPVNADAPAAPASNPGASIAAASGRPRVLVVDDEPAIGAFLLRALGHAGCEPVLAADGPGAIAIVRDTTVDAVLCDHRMAGMSGMELYAAVVDARPELAARFALMSGDVLDPDLRSFADTNGILLLGKPFDVGSVGRVVRQLLAGDEGQPRVEGQPRG